LPNILKEEPEETRPNQQLNDKQSKAKIFFLLVVVIFGILLITIFVKAFTKNKKNFRKAK
jgi:hypothetical protein